MDYKNEIRIANGVTPRTLNGGEWPVKTINCNRCGRLCATIEKGSVRKESVMLCDKCNDLAKAAEEMARYSNRTSEPDFIRDLFNLTDEGRR